MAGAAKRGKAAGAAAKTTTKAKATKAKVNRKGVGGRPPKYDPETTPKQAYKLCANGGFDDADMADFFEVDPSTISRWKNEHPEFQEAIRAGKDYFDTERVEKALVHRAIGYSHPEDDIRTANGEVIITPTTKHYPPDTAAAIFWLKNRNKDRWRDKIEHDHGIQEDSPLATLLQQVAGNTLKPTEDDPNAP